MEDKNYKEYAKKILSQLTPIFAKASVGDFSQDVEIPDQDDEFTQVFVGVQIMVEVIREKIAEQTSLNEALLKSLEEKDALLDSVGDGLIATDEKGRIVVMNKAAEQILGWTLDEILGKFLAEIVSIFDGQDSNKSLSNRPITEALVSGKKVVGDFFYARKNQTKFPVGLTVTPYLLEGKSIGAIEVFRDITFQKEVDKMKSGFLSLAAHELRTPLGLIRWHLELLLQDPHNFFSKEVREELRKVYGDNLRMLTLVNDLLNVSRIDEGKVPNTPKLIDINQEIKMALKEVSDLVNKKLIKVNFQTQDLPPILIDPKRFKEVIVNLLANAIKYNQVNGQLDINTKNDNLEIEISIKDSGIGIPDNAKAQIFNKFFRADNASLSDSEGTGLGLFVVKSYVESWGGKIWFESQQYQGSTFHFTLPIAKKIPA
ncbi:PAS domain-containing protein [Candidatus Daviesbacteria bacterium]|nr:PAS domain-containing protein [Candidatus Daviesbacteria bacterium]